jgi:hypothetical protein
MNEGSDLMCGAARTVRTCQAVQPTLHRYDR